MVEGSVMLPNCKQMLDVAVLHIERAAMVCQYPTTVPQHWVASSVGVRVDYWVLGLPIGSSTNGRPALVTKLNSSRHRRGR